MEKLSSRTKINTTWIAPSFSKKYQHERQLIELNDNQLLIPNIQQEDGQNWKCVVSNEFGSDIVEFHLQVLGKNLIKDYQTRCFSLFCR